MVELTRIKDNNLPPLPPLIIQKFPFRPCLCWRIPSFVATLESKFSHPMTSSRRYRWYQEISVFFHCCLKSLKHRSLWICVRNHSVCIYSISYDNKFTLLWRKTPLQLKEIPLMFVLLVIQVSIMVLFEQPYLQLEGKYWVNQQAQNANNQWLTHEIATWVANPRHFWRFITLRNNWKSRPGLDN